jgi:hypothetical protein
MNQSLQGPRENVLTSSDNILGFKRKMNLWKNHVVTGNLEMLPLLLGLENEEGYQQVSSLTENHLDPYPESSAQPDNLTLREDKELCELQSQHEIY